MAGLTAVLTLGPTGRIDPTIRRNKAGKDFPTTSSL